MLTISINDREFNRALEELAGLSKSADSHIVKMTTGFLLRNLARVTPRFRRKRPIFEWFVHRLKHAELWKGYARSGWWAAWRKLGLSGMPGIRNAELPARGPGGVIDRSRDLGRPFITVWNSVTYIEILNLEYNILSKAMRFQLQKMMQSVDRIYTRILRSKSG